MFSRAPLKHFGSSNFWRNAGLAAAFAVPFLVYLATLAPSLNFEDSAEFALGAATLGVDHPSGYPLETLVAHTFTAVPVGALARRMNLSSAFFAALASLFVFALVWEWLATTGPPSRLAAAAAWAAAGLFAFSRSFWPQAVITEVYALNAALVAGALYSGLRYYRLRDGRWFYLSVFLAALAAANHPTSLALTAPFAAYLWWRRRGRRPAWPPALALALFGVSVYLYLALRASRGPTLNWGQPATAAIFLDHIRRREFGTIYWPRYRYFALHLAELGKLLFVQFGAGVGLLAAPAAAYLLWRRARPSGALAAVLVIAGPLTLLPLVGLLTPIQIFEIDVWYIPFFLLAAAFIGAAAATFFRKVSSRRWRAGAAAALALLPLYPLAANFARADLRDVAFAAEHGGNLLRTYPYRTIVGFPFYGWQGLFTQSYLRFVYGRRPDVAFVEPRNTVRSEIAATRRAPRFIVDPDAAAAWWFAFRRGLFRSYPGRPFFYNTDDAEAAATGAQVEPFGLVFRVRRPGEKLAVGPPPWGRYKYDAFRKVGRALAAGRTNYQPTSYRVWANYFAMAAQYCFARGRPGLGRRNLDAALPAAARDANVAWLLASLYSNYGYPGRAVPLYESVLRRLEHYRYDALMFRRDYAGLLNGLAIAYLRAGDATRAGRYFAEARGVCPEQPGLAGRMSPEELAAAASYFQKPETPPRPRGPAGR